MIFDENNLRFVKIFKIDLPYWSDPVKSLE